jgi:hypothetical protein
MPGFATTPPFERPCRAAGAACGGFAREPGRAESRQPHRVETSPGVHDEGPRGPTGPARLGKVWGGLSHSKAGASQGRFGTGGRRRHSRPSAATSSKSRRRSLRRRRVLRRPAWQTPSRPRGCPLELAEPEERCRGPPAPNGRPARAVPAKESGSSVRDFEYHTAGTSRRIAMALKKSDRSGRRPAGSSALPARRDHQDLDGVLASVFPAMRRVGG